VPKKSKIAPAAGDQENVDAPANDPEDDLIWLEEQFAILPHTAPIIA
jgi:hypothetical protein